MIHYIILSMLLCSSFLSANKYYELYHKANKLLKTEQYQDALELYESLTPQGPVTYYNTGIALYHLQQYAQALSVWEKSEQHASAKLLKKIQTIDFENTTFSSKFFSNKIFNSKDTLFFVKPNRCKQRNCIVS